MASKKGYDDIFLTTIITHMHLLWDIFMQMYRTVKTTDKGSGTRFQYFLSKKIPI